MHQHAIRLCAALSLSLFACTDSADVELDSIDQDLSTTSWSAPGMVGPDQQAARYSGAMATLNGTTYMVHSGNTTNDLWWTKLTPSGWTTDVQIPNQQSARRASLAVFNNTLYMLHSGNGSPSEVWFSRFNPASQTWSGNSKLVYTSEPAPAMAEYNGRLVIVGATPSSGKLWMASMSTSEVFSPAVAMEGHYSAGAITLAAHNGSLYMAHRASTSTTIVLNAYNGTSWGFDQTIDSGNGTPITGYEASIASHDGYLHLVHTRPGSLATYWTYFDGWSWPAEITIGTHYTKINPRIAKGGTGLILLEVHLTGSSSTGYSDTLIWSQYQSP